MNSELIEAIRLLTKERGVDEDVLFEAIEESLVTAYKREFGIKDSDNIRAEVDKETGEMRVFLAKEIVAEVLNPHAEISLEEAKSMSAEFEIGDELEYQLSPQDFGRLAAQSAKNVINQKLFSAERERIENEFSSKIGDIAAGVVQRKDKREVIVDIGRAEAILPYHEQSRLDVYNFNQRMRFLILKVDVKKNRPIIYVSRSHPNLVRKLFEQEVPEIVSGVVEIVSVSREAGSRSKIAVTSRDPNVDSVGACVGQRGLRVQAVIDELMGEKIDIIEWDSDITVFISNALSPSKVVRVDVIEEEEMARVVVPDHQLSLAIGRAGQNARLAARLTNWKIDIKSESQYREAIEQELLANFSDAVTEQIELNEENELEAEALENLEEVAEVAEAAEEANTAEVVAQEEENEGETSI